MRKRWMALTAAATVALLPIGQASASGAGPTWKTVHISFHPTPGGVPTLSDTVCNDANPSLCVYLSKFVSFTVGGDLVGTDIEGDAAAFAPTNGQVVLNATGYYTGTVKGCGTGSFVYTNHLAFNSALGTGPVPYVIEPTAGGGDFVGMTGHFTDAGTGSLNGVVRCAGPGH